MKQITIPTSKSISNRLLILQKTSGIHFIINNLSIAEDTKLLSDLLKQIETSSSFPTHLDCGNCGTAYRFLTAFLACKSGSWILDGSERMQQRPIKELVETLRDAGADITYLKKEGFPPLAINGKPLNTNYLEVDSTQSSQYVSALAMVLPLWGKEVQLQFSNHATSLQYIDMTLALMQDLGLNIVRNENVISYHPSEKPSMPIDFFVEYDWSAAAVWFLLAALISEGTIFIEGLQKSKLQADTIITDWVKAFGVETDYQKNGVLLTKNSSPLPESFTADCKNNLDLVPYIATLCAALSVRCRLYNIENLRFKESNRTEVLQTELSKIANVSIKDHSLMIEPNNKPLPDFVSFSSHGDHRIAMSLSVLAAVIPQVQIDDMDCVKKSYPDFVRVLLKMLPFTFPYCELDIHATPRFLTKS